MPKKQELPLTPCPEEPQPRTMALAARDERWGLLPNQVLFAYRYVATGNGARSVIEAGYSNKAVTTAVYQLLTNPKVKRAIEDIRKDAMDKLKVDAEYVISNLVAEAENFEDKNAGNRIKALNMLGQYLGIFKADGGVTVNIPCKVFVGVNQDKV